MSVNLTRILESNTFSNWVDTTNLLIDFADIAMTLNANNTGDTSLSGNFSVGNNDIISTNNIAAVSGGKVTVNSKLQANDEIILDKSSGESVIQFKLGGSDTWSFETVANHTAVAITDGTHNLTIADDGDITATGRISNDMLPIDISLVGTVTATGVSTFPSVAITGGNITGLATLGTGDNPIISSVITSADINGGSIDGTTIGGTSAAAGSFTTISGNGNASITGDLAVTGTITGDVTGTATVANSLTSNAIEQIMNALYPIGSLWITTLSTEPNQNQIPGVWERYAKGSALVGYDDGTVVSSASVNGGVTTVLTANAHGFAKGDVVRLSGFSAGNGAFTVTSVINTTKFTINRSGSTSGGSKKVQLDSARTASSSTYDVRGRNSITLSVGQLPEHAHDILSNNVTEVERFSDSRTPIRELRDDSTQDLKTNTTQNTGNGDGINVQNRSVVIYVWKRTGA